MRRDIYEQPEEAVTVILVRDNREKNVAMWTGRKGGVRDPKGRLDLHFQGEVKRVKRRW